MPYDDIPASLPSMLASYLHMDEPSDAQKSLGALSLRDVMARPAHSGGQAPAAVPPQMAAAKISPRMPANLDGAQSLATPAQIPSDAPVLTDVSPQAQPAPALTAGANTGARPPKPPPVDDLAEAQAEAAHQRKLIGVGGLMAHAADVSRGADTSATDKLYAGMAAQADQPVKDLLQKHERLQQMQAEQAQKDLADPNSDISKRTQLVAAGQGIKGVTGMSAADFQRMQPLIEKGMTAQQAKDTLAAENTRAANAIAAENMRAALAQRGESQRQRETLARDAIKDTETNRHNQAMEEVDRTKKAGDNTEKELERYGKEMEPIEALKDNMEQLRSSVAEGAPGIGPITGKLPPSVISDKGINTRQVIAKAGVDYMKALGQRYNEHEAEKVMESFGIKKNATADELRLGIERMDKEIQSRQSTINARHSPSVISTFNAAHGAEAQAPSVGGATVVERRQTKSGKFLEKLSDGTIREAR